MRYFFFKYLTAEIELYYSNVHLATPLSDKRLPIIVQSYKLTPVTARIGHCDEIWRDLRTTAKGDRDQISDGDGVILTLG